MTIYVYLIICITKYIYIYIFLINHSTAGVENEDGKGKTLYCKYLSDFCLCLLDINHFTINA